MVSVNNVNIGKVKLKQMIIPFLRFLLIFAFLPETVSEHNMLNRKRTSTR